MTAVSVTYFFQAPECLNLSTSIAYPVGIVVAVALLILFCVKTFGSKKSNDLRSAQSK